VCLLYGAGLVTLTKCWLSAGARCTGGAVLRFGASRAAGAIILASTSNVYDMDNTKPLDH
jgi:hypothetical protein